MEHQDKSKAMNADSTHMKAENTSDYLPIYRETSHYARENGETSLYRISLRENCACKDAIEKAINKNFDGWYLNDAGAREVLKQFGDERVNYVLANTVQIANWDARYSTENRRWAEAIPVAGDPRDMSCSRDAFVVRSHPSVLNGFISQVRKAERERPSVLEALKNLSVQQKEKPAPARKSQEVER